MRVAKACLIAVLLTLPAALVACGGDTGDTTSSGSGSGGASSSSSSSASSASSASSSASTSGSSSSSGGCMPAPVPGKTITGTITYAGQVGPKDVLRIAAFKNGMPGIPASVDQKAMPVFPYTYQLTGLKVDTMVGFTNYGVLAYLDVNGDSPMGPGMGDPQAPASMVVKITECEGAKIDLTIP